MKKKFKVGDRVMIPDEVSGEFATVIGVNSDGTINLTWLRGGYAYNRNPEDYVKVELLKVPYKGLILDLRSGGWDDIMNSCFYVTIDHINGFYICVDKSSNVLFARNDYGYVSKEFQ